MSIYLYSRKINDILGKEIIKLEFPRDIAEAGENKLSFTEYSENKLERFSRKKEVKIHPYFWNHNYCNLQMLDDKISFKDLKTPDTIIIDDKLFGLGNIIMMVTFFNILSLTFEIPDGDEKYDKLLNRLNIDRNIFAEFLTYNKFKFPLRDNYLKLIKRVFTCNNIIDFVFTKPIIYNYQYISTILNYFDYGSLNDLSKYIFESNLSNKEKLCLCNELIDTYPDEIDKNPVIYLDMSNFKPYLCYYLYTMDVEEELINFYYYIWQIFLDNKGAYKLVILDNEELQYKICQRLEVIKDTFDIKETYE